MALFVVADPLLPPDDREKLERLRAQYHPGEAALIGPHFTLLFGAPDEQLEPARDSLASLKDSALPFWFSLERLRVSTQPGSPTAHLYAEPEAGAAELVALYEQFNPQATGEAYEPHMTLGRFASAAEAERIAQMAERQLDLPIRGRVVALRLARLKGGALETLEQLELG